MSFWNTTKEYFIFIHSKHYFISFNKNVQINNKKYRRKRVLSRFVDGQVCTMKRPRIGRGRIEMLQQTHNKVVLPGLWSQQGNMIHDAGSDHLAHFEQSHPTDSSLGKTRRNLCKNLLVQHVLQVVERLAVMKLQNEPLWNVLQMDRWHDQQRFRSILDNQGFVTSELNPLECWSWFPQTLRWMLENKKGSSFSKSFHFVEYQPKKCRNGRLNRTACSTDAGVGYGLSTLATQHSPRAAGNSQCVETPVQVAKSAPNRCAGWLCRAAPKPVQKKTPTIWTQNGNSGRTNLVWRWISTFSVFLWLMDCFVLFSDTSIMTSVCLRWQCQWC